MNVNNVKTYILLPIFVVVLLGILWFSYVPSPTIMRLYEQDYPNEYVPMIVTANGTFFLSSSFERVWIGAQEVQNEEGIISIPKDFSPGWYPLIIHVNGKNITHNNALYVTPVRLEDFTFVQVTDVHTPCYNGSDIQERKHVFELINNLGPAFVVDTGDMTDYGLEEQYRYYEYITSVLDMPLYTIPGNMETYSDPHLERYAYHRGPGNYYFYFDRTLFIAGAGLHSPRSWGGFDNAQINWINATISKEADLIFFLHHIPIVAQQGRDYHYVPWGWREGHFSQIENGYQDIVTILTREHAFILSGHWHGYVDTFQYKGATFYNTPSVTRMSGVQEGPRFRLFQIQNNTITYDNVLETGKLHISREYRANNTQVTIRIQNDEGVFVPLCIHASLSPKIKSYSTNQGEIIKISVSGDVWVKYMAPQGESELIIAPGS